MGFKSHEAFCCKHRLPAVEMIFDRLEVRARQQIEVADIIRELHEKSDEELRFYVEHNRWPDGEQEQSLALGQAKLSAAELAKNREVERMSHCP